MPLLIVLLFLGFGYGRSYGQDARVPGMWEIDTSYQVVDSLFSYSVTLRAEYYFDANLDVEMRARVGFTIFGRTTLTLIQIFGTWNTATDSLLMTRRRQITITDPGGPNEQIEDDYTVETDTSAYRFLDPGFSLMEVTGCDSLGCDTTVIQKTGNAESFTLPDLTSVVAVRDLSRYRSAQGMKARRLPGEYGWRGKAYDLNGRGLRGRAYPHTLELR